MKRRLFLSDKISRFAARTNVKIEDCFVIDLKNINLGLDLDENIDKEAIEREYIDLIASLGKKDGSIYWWASYLSEKNSLTSKLFPRLYSLFVVDKKIRKIQDKDIIIFSSDRVLMRQIAHNYRKSFAVKYLSKNIMATRLSGLKAEIKGVFGQVKKALSEYRKLLIVRYLLHESKDIIKKERPFVVIRTWLTPGNYRSGSFRDSYFQGLLKFLSSEGKNLLIFGGIISDYKDMIGLFKGNKTDIVIPTDFYLKGIDVFRCLLGVCFYRPIVRKKPAFLEMDIRHLILAELSHDIITTRFFDVLLQYYSCKRLAESVCIERFIYTFENYAWEKLSILGLRSQSPGIKITGFQHAFISKNSFRYFPGNEEKDILPLPDRIITIGKRVVEILKERGRYPEGIFSVGCALRQEYLFGLSPLTRNRNGDILAVFTMTIEETIKMVDFILEGGLADRPEKVYLRFHPATIVDDVFKNLKFTLPSNFIVSDNPDIKTEIERCGIVLYTQTTVCLEALKLGRPVIYLDVNYPIEADPLFECNCLRDVCRTPSDLITKIERMRYMDEDTFKEQFDKAQVYLDEYFSPVEEKALAAFIE